MREKILFRAKMLENIRAFFSERDVIEVETPSLCSYSVTDVYIDSFRVPSPLRGEEDLNRFLQTSPEYAMKRLLVENCGSIYQICKSFRVDEPSKKHNPEFTMLEWYRLDFNHHQLMDEIDEFLIRIINSERSERYNYQSIYEKYLNFNPFETEISEIQNIAKSKDFLSNNLIGSLSKFDLLDVLFTHFIEPKLGHENAPVFVYDFPAEQAALAKIREENPRVGERFEVYMRGMELANGFHELGNAEEQKQRFIRDQKTREKENKFIPEIDFRFLEALKKGLPNCSGVAIGIDRLLMLKTGSTNIEDILCFPWNNI